jgi:hypothetical protein
LALTTNKYLLRGKPSFNLMAGLENILNIMGKDVVEDEAET